MATGRGYTSRRNQCSEELNLQLKCIFQIVKTAVKSVLLLGVTMISLSDAIIRM